MDTDDVQLPHLRTFSKAAELSSFTAAAKALGLTQAAVSQRIRALEKSLDKSLFQRRGGRVMLTEAGQTPYTYVQQILDLHREARKEIAGQEPKVDARVVAQNGHQRRLAVRYCAEQHVAARSWTKMARK